MHDICIIMSIQNLQNIQIPVLNWQHRKDLLEAGSGGSNRRTVWPANSLVFLQSPIAIHVFVRGAGANEIVHLPCLYEGLNNSRHYNKLTKYLDEILI